MTAVEILVAARREVANQYYKNLSAQPDFRVQIVSALEDVPDTLADQSKHVDILVLDNQIGHTFELVNEIRHSYPRLFIILVDEEADFGMPGRADEISTDPFKDNDLIRRITKLMSDRQLETLRADSLPAVRQFAKELRHAAGEGGKQQVTVTACKNLGYDYVAFYRMVNANPITLVLKAQDGPAPIQAVSPKESEAQDLITWVLQHGQSRVAGSGDTPNHPLVTKGRLGAVACVPVSFSGNRYGVLAVFREEAGSISEEQVMHLELMAAQLGSAISKELIG